MPCPVMRVPLPAALRPAAMRNRGLTAPLHPAAEAAFEAIPRGSEWHPRHRGHENFNSLLASARSGAS